jgi:hypothetical protein
MLIEQDRELRGNLEHRMIAKVDEVLLRFQDEVHDQARRMNVHISQVSILRPCNLSVFVDEGDIHVVFTNSDVGRFPLAIYDDITKSAPITSANAIYLAQVEYDWRNCSAFTFPKSLLDLSRIEQEPAIQKLAEHYLTQEQACLERLRGRVRFSPLFQGRDFIIDRSFVFVLMPFQPRFQDIFVKYIKPAVDDCKAGLQCTTAQDIFKPGQIMEQIWECINRARFIIADLTGRNPNVFYELGVAHTIGKTVILLAQSKDDIPFDLQHLRVIIYLDNEGGREELRKALHGYVETLLENESQ